MSSPIAMVGCLRAGAWSFAAIEHKEQMNLKIETFSTQVACLAKDLDPIEDGPGTVVANFVTLQLRTDDGIEGVGYSGFIPMPMLRSLKEAVDGLAAIVIGEHAFQTEAIQEKLLRIGGFGSAAGIVTLAAAAIDVALWDIKGKALGQPIHQILGGYRDQVPTYASGKLWRTYDTQMLASAGMRLIDEGFTAIKFRMGDADSDVMEIQRMKALRNAVGDEIQIMADINQAWDVNRSICVGRAMEECNLYWLEDPIDHQNYDGLAQIAGALDTPIAAGEYVYGIAPFRHMFQCGSVDIAMIDLLRAGGITPWMKIAHLAEAYQLPVVTHLAPEILAHCLAAIPNGLIVEHMPWSMRLFEQKLLMKDGEMLLSNEPGLGLSFDERAIAHFQP